MTAPQTRRPLPALIFIAALLLLTALVWFRVLDHSQGDEPVAPKTCPTPSAPAPTALPTPGKVSVLVLNSTSRNGLAGDTKTALQKAGFQVTQATNDSPAYGGHGLIKGVAEIRYGPASTSAARLLKVYLPKAKEVRTTSTSPTVTVSLGRQFHRLRTAKEVAVALRKAGLTSRATAPLAVPTPSPTC